MKSPPQLDPQRQRDFAVDVVRKLRERGFEAYWAGGCVRDSLLGRTPKDYDVGTTATPEQIRDVFGARHTIPVGAQFGVVRVVGLKSAGDVEVATFRRDTTYSDGRHPDSVEFSTADADAHRRDFTINGLFYDPVEDRVIDLVGGVDDLGRRIVRAIGEPRARFEEDKLRLLRAVRFAATFEFTLDVPTRSAVEAMASQITIVSAERIAAEMRLMLVHQRRASAVDLLREVGLLAVILPELAMANQPGSKTLIGRPADEAWLAALDTLDALAEPEFPLALAGLLHSFVDAKRAAEIGRRWKLANREITRVRWLIANQESLGDAQHKPWSALQPIVIAEGIADLIALIEAQAAAAGIISAAAAYCRELLKKPRHQLDPPPLVTGDDLIELGIPRGKEYSRLLREIRDAQLDEKIATKPEALALVDRLQRQTHGNPDMSRD
jgi:tRNA nucleotidyltransferase/poly(A) polymerase